MRGLHMTLVLSGENPQDGSSLQCGLQAEERFPRHTSLFGYVMFHAYLSVLNHVEGYLSGNN